MLRAIKIIATQITSMVRQTKAYRMEFPVYIGIIQRLRSLW